MRTARSVFFPPVTSEADAHAVTLPERPLPGCVLIDCSKPVQAGSRASRSVRTCFQLLRVDLDSRMRPHGGGRAIHKGGCQQSGEESQSYQVMRNVNCS